MVVALMLRVFSAFTKRFRFIMSKFNNNNTVVVVLGATGTGKSKLAIEIASKFQGEIINADSMQIYKGLDIATNKVSKEERLAVPHHMLDFLEPSKFYNVVDFRDATLPIIKRIHNEGKVPVVVGGTHYYVESILWNVLVGQTSENNKFDNIKDVLDRIKFIWGKISEINKNKNLNKSHEESDSNEIPPQSGKIYECSQSDNNISQSVSSSRSEENSNKASDKNNSSDNVKYCISEKKKLIGYINSELVSNEMLLSLLGFVDSKIAESNHPNNRRRILRSLEVWIETGVCHSEFIRRQSADVGGADLGGRIRFENVAILWVTCDKSVLDKRLDGRVDLMLEQNLLKELSDFHSTHYQRLISIRDEECEKGASLTSANDSLRKGIFQSIGFKELENYLNLNDEERKTNKGKALYREGIDMMKLRTRQYSRSQLKWIRNRFFLRERMKLPVYAVDATDPSLWKEKVSPIAEEVVRSILNGEVPSSPPVVLHSEDNGSDKGDKTRFFCDVCERVFIGNYQWQIHLKSERHRKVLKRKNANEETKADEKYSKVSV